MRATFGHTPYHDRGAVPRRTNAHVGLVAHVNAIGHVAYAHAMSLFDFFFPEQAQAVHLRTIANATRLERRRRLNRKAAGTPPPPPSAVEQRITALEADLGFASLVLAALMARLDERGVVTKGDVRALVDEIDGHDGVKDGRLDVSILRNLKG